MDNNENQGNLEFPAAGTSELITLSDVLNTIQDDLAETMFHNPDLPSSSQQLSPQMNGVQAEPYVIIEEQPAPKALRFRYECEGRSAGAIPGATSTAENKTYPTIKVMNYTGRAVVVVSCVTKDAPYKPHPHNLVGREGCRRGVCTLEINSDDMRMVFSNLGVQCVKKRDIEEALRTREEIRVDPFRTGYAHRSQPSSIDLNSVRLCFQVFLEGPQRGKFTTPVKPVVSEPIYDKKSMSDLVITKLSHNNAVCNGGQEMILLCEKIAKEDITIRFYEETVDGWEGFGEFQHSHVHKQVAIPFKTPRYKSTEITEPVKIKIQLKRPSDGATSESLDFEMLPLNEDQNEMKRKRHRSRDDTALNGFKSPALEGHLLKVINDQPVKLEPRESPYQMYHGNYRDNTQATPSPQPNSPHNMFNPISPSPVPYHSPNILQGQLQRPVQSMPTNNFNQAGQTSQIFAQNITQTFAPGPSVNWNNTNVTSGGKVYATLETSTNVFQQPMASAQPLLVQQPQFNANFNSNQESFNIDESFNIENLSGDLRLLSFSDIQMDSFSKTGERQNGPNQ